MVKYEVIDYEVSSDPVAEPVASSTSLDGEVSFINQAADLHRVRNRVCDVKSSDSLSHLPGEETVLGRERLTMWNALNLSRAVVPRTGSSSKAERMSSGRARRVG